MVFFTLDRSYVVTHFVILFSISFLFWIFAYIFNFPFLPISFFFLYTRCQLIQIQFKRRYIYIYMSIHTHIRIFRCKAKTRKSIELIGPAYFLNRSSYIFLFVWNVLLEFTTLILNTRIQIRILVESMLHIIIYLLNTC